MRTKFHAQISNAQNMKQKREENTGSIALITEMNIIIIIIIIIIVIVYNSDYGIN